ncbi:MAG: phosphotransacetylase family protein [Deltaproteobacteria bacterium]|nr:phosphotransacetylase family protein [Deltaproteobacteria bacterium]
MRSIFIGSTGGEPGQTLATWALAVKLKEKGLQVGFFKPYGLLPDTGTSAESGFCDADVLLIKDVLGLSEPEEALCPVMLTENLIAEVSGSHGERLTEKIKGAFREISLGKDVILIMGAEEIFFGGGLSGLSDSVLVKLFDASVLLVDRYQRDNLTLYSLLSLNSFLEGRVKSAIINHVSPDRMDHVRTKVVPFLKEKGVNSVAAIPEDPILAALTVSTIADLVDGQILCSPERAGNLIETFTIGSKYLLGSLSIFKQVYNKIILVGLGQPTQTEKTVGGIILTGGKSPGELVLKVAHEHSLPLILTRADTFQTMEWLEKAKPSLGRKDEFKVHQFLKLIDQEMSANQWVEALL